MEYKEQFFPGFECEDNQIEDVITEPEIKMDDERVLCSYCQDVGVCTYCKRGKEELVKDRENQFKKRHKGKKAA